MKAYIDLVVMVDTHELHREIEVPAGDVLIHAGDFTMLSRSRRAIADFNAWLGELPHRHKLVIPGNHEYFLEAEPWKRSLLSNATLLADEGIEIDGLRVWGSPTTPSDGAAFGVSSSADRQRHWIKIPTTDVLITHGPPWGILDQAYCAGEHLGDPELLEAVTRLHPRVHVFGHVHEAYGQMIVGETLYMNCALLGADGALAYDPMRLRIPRC